MLYYYRRELPCPPAISYSSLEGKRLFAEALQVKVISFIHQKAWLIFLVFLKIHIFLFLINRHHKSMLEGCRNLEEMRNDGISFDELACLARCNSLNAIPKRPLYRHEYENDAVSKPQIMKRTQW